jgi:hypothetical protein
MLYLFDKCYRKGDPKLMHVRRDHVFLRLTGLYTCHASIVPKPFSTLTEVHHAYKYTSISTISLSTVFERQKHPMTALCTYSFLLDSSLC